MNQRAIPSLHLISKRLKHPVTLQGPNLCENKENFCQCLPSERISCVLSETIKV